MKNIIFLVLMCACLSACNEESVASTEGSQLKENPVTAQSASEKPVNITGTVVYKEIEGGFYGFVSDDGKPYTLKGMSSDYHKNGLRIAVTGQPRHDVMTFTQFGTVFQVDKVKVIDDSNVKPVNSVR